MRVASSFALIICLAASALPASAQGPAGVPTPPAPPIRRGSRVRITTAEVVELPGVVRIDARTTSAAILSSDDESITVKGTAGRAMTFARPNRRVVGLLSALDDAMITLARKKGSEIVVPRAAVRKVERSTGQRSRTTSVLWGLAIGVSGGAAVGYLIGSNRRCPGFLSPPGSPATHRCFLEPQGSTAIGGIFGGGAGAVLGVFLPRQERWATVDVGSLTTR